MIEWYFVEVTNICNFHCKFCPSDHLKRQREHIDFELFKKAVDQIAMTNYSRPIQLQVMGEPLLHPQIFEAIDYCKMKGLQVILFTNAGDIKKNIAEICRHDNIHAVVISLQTPTAESFKLRGVSKPFDQYIEDIYESMEYIIKSGYIGHFRLEIHLANTKPLPFRDWAVIENEDQAFQVLRSIGERLRNMYYGDPTLDLSKVPKNILDVPESEYFGYMVLPNVFLRFKWMTTMGSYRDCAPCEVVEAKTARRCPLAETLICVLSNGDITLCCLDAEGDTKIGNIKEISIQQALTSEKRLKLLEDLTQVKVCKRCLGSVRARPLSIWQQLISKFAVFNSLLQD